MGGPPSAGGRRALRRVLRRQRAAPHGRPTPWPGSRRVPSATPSCIGKPPAPLGGLAAGPPRRDLLARRSGWPTARGIRCPVQIVAGERDHFPTVAMSRRLAETIPGARLHVVAEGPHFPNRSHRAEVQGVMDDFLSLARHLSAGRPRARFAHPRARATLPRDVDRHAGAHRDDAWDAGSRRWETWVTIVGALVPGTRRRGHRTLRAEPRRAGRGRGAAAIPPADRAARTISSASSSTRSRPSPRATTTTPCAPF